MGETEEPTEAEGPTESDPEEPTNPPVPEDPTVTIVHCLVDDVYPLPSKILFQTNSGRNL